MQIKILDRYIFKQVFSASMVCIALFVIVWLAPETMVNLIKAVMEKEITWTTGLKIFVYSVPYVLSKALPVGILLGCLYSFNRMSKDSELTVIRGCGIDFWRITIMPMVLGAIFTIICFFICDKCIPYSSIGLSAEKKEVRGNHFVYALKDSNKNLEQLVIAKNYDSIGHINDVVVLNFNPENKSKISLLSDIIISEKAVASDFKWDLYGNHQYIIKYDGVYDTVKTPEKVSILHGKSAQIVKQLMTYNLKKDRELTNSQMKKYMKILKTEEIEDLYNSTKNKYLQRFFHSAICILFAILGCLLGYCNPREQKLVGFTIAIGIIFIYYMSLNFVDLMAEKSILSPWITATIHPILIYLLIHFYKKNKGI